MSKEITVKEAIRLLKRKGITPKLYESLVKDNDEDKVVLRGSQEYEQEEIGVQDVKLGLGRKSE